MVPPKSATQKAEEEKKIKVSFHREEDNVIQWETTEEYHCDDNYPSAEGLLQQAIARGDIDTPGTWYVCFPDGDGDINLRRFELTAPPQPKFQIKETGRE